jgi:GntR family transcriptional regulator
MYYNYSTLVRMSGLAAKAKGFRFELDLRSGVPVYRQIIDRVRTGIATGALAAGDQLPTVRQLAVDLAINPNTVMRAYRELELGGTLETHQGTGTFISNQRIIRKSSDRERQLAQLAGDFAARAGELGFTVEELLDHLRQLIPQSTQRR